MNGVQVYRKHEINESEGRDKPGTLEWLAPRRSEALLMSEVYFGGVGWSVHCAQNIHSIEDNSDFTCNFYDELGRKDGKIPKVASVFRTVLAYSFFTPLSTQKTFSSKLAYEESIKH